MFHLQLCPLFINLQPGEEFAMFFLQKVILLSHFIWLYGFVE